MRNYVAFKAAVVDWDVGGVSQTPLAVIEANVVPTGEFNVDYDIDVAIGATVDYYVQNFGLTGWSAAKFQLYVELDRENVLYLLGFGPGTNALAFFSGRIPLVVSPWDKYEERFDIEESPRGKEKRKFRLVPIRK